ncbi:hypothetical protein ABVV53_02750 [Novosphingobium sp. RD2P27]|uniref:Uncharacterized protein n=1 Tax=Novosphingobium kalidii TaxID=3230299 RepID=A0ABV2CXR3_9SPHN
MLRISLREGEKIVVNGAVMKAVGREKILVGKKVSIGSANGLHAAA